MEHDKTAPHQSVILIKSETYQILPNSYVTNLPVDKNSRVVTIIGRDFDDCQKKTDEFFQQIGVKHANQE